MKPSPQPTILLIEDEHHADLELYRREISAVAPGATIHAATSSAEAMRYAGDVTVIVGKAHSISAQLIGSATRLQWIHSLTTGIDAIIAAQPRADILITTARGVHGPQMSELAFMLMLSLVRDFRRVLNDQANSHWNKRPQSLLYGKTIGIVGVGAIAFELALRCKTFGMQVIGVSDGVKQADNFDAIRPRSALVEVAGSVDILLLLIPLKADTRHIINAAVLNALRPDAYLVNLARGPVVDEAALIEALRACKFAGAALDVFETEPLPKESPLWSLPNVIVTPHIGGLSAIYGQQNVPILVENMRAWVAGDLAGMRNRVTR
jgi:phosphoglycerate dehydrogenase-like enzyme